MATAKELDAAVAGDHVVLGATLKKKFVTTNKDGVKQTVVKVLRCAIVEDSVKTLEQLESEKADAAKKLAELDEHLSVAKAK
jgi:hypothetical protein